MNEIPSTHDAIIAEIHAIRERFSEQYHNDLAAYSQAAEAHCRALGFQIVGSPRLQPNAEPVAKTEDSL